MTNKQVNEVRQAIKCSIGNKPLTMTQRWLKQVTLLACLRLMSTRCRP